MAIRVKHGGGNIAALVRLAAAAGAAQAKAPQAPTVTPMGAPRGGGGGGGGRRRNNILGMSRDTFAFQANELKARRDQQMQAIEAQADRDKQAADYAMKKTALKTGLDKEMQEQEYDQTVQKMKEQAKIDAGLFTWKIGEQDKQKMAKLNNALSGWKTKFENKEIDEKTFLAGKAAIEKQIAGITPAAFKAEEKPTPINEQIVVGKDGNSYAPSRLVSKVGDYRYTREGMAETAKQEAAKKQADEMQDWENKLYESELSDKLAAKSSIPLRVRVNAQMRARYGSKYELSEGDLRAAAQYNLEELYPEAGYEGQTIQRAVAPQPQQQPQQQAPQPVLPPQQAEAAIAGTGDWWSPLEGQGVPVPEKYRNMSPDLGTSHAVYDAYMEKFGTFADVPEKYKPAVARMIVMINEQESEDKKERDVYERWKGALNRGE